MPRFQYKAYRRSFSKQWLTGGAPWTSREGILVRVEDTDGRPGFGEVAPIESFGSESFLAALGACAALEQVLQYEKVSASLAPYPALRFGIESAIAMLEADEWNMSFEKPWPVCGLLRDFSDEAEVEALLQQGFRALKAKVGILDFNIERRLLERLIDQAGESIPIRLDANGSLSLEFSRSWLEFLAELPSVEFFEQPMAKGNEEEMIALASDFPTPLALDESVCSVDDLKRWRDRQWPGVYVLKPLLSGGYNALIDELQQGELDAVFSSSLETSIGAGHALRIAARFPAKRRPLGFDTAKLFGDTKLGLLLGSFFRENACPSLQDMESLWNEV